MSAAPMDIEKLKKIERKATPGPWKVHQLNLLLKHEDAALVAHMRALFPEMLALWEAAKLGCFRNCDCELCRAVHALELKTEGLL